jgi:hypothetical protein
MILDNRASLARSEEITGSVGRAQVGDVINQEKTPITGASPEYGPLAGLCLVVRLGAAVASAEGGASVAFEVITGDVVTLDGGDEDILIATGPIPEAQLGAGAVVLAVELARSRRFIGLFRTVTGEMVTQGRVDAFFTPDASQWKAYAAPGQA